MKRRSLLYFGVGLAVFGASSFLPAAAQQRGGVTRRVQFSPGSSSAIINGSVQLGRKDTYIFRANKGQQIIVDVTWKGERADGSDELQGLSGFTFIAPDGQSYEDPQDSKFEATSTGEYKVVIAQPYKLSNPRYTFKLTIR